MVITDRITFIPDEGPFKIEVMLGANIALLEPMSPTEITKLIILKKCLVYYKPVSAAFICIIAHITDKMGFSL